MSDRPCEAPLSVGTERMKTSTILASILAATLASTPAARAEDEPAPGADTLFGDVGGARSTLAEHGISIESILTVDTISNVHGGVKRQTTALGNYDLLVTTDTEKLWGVPGGTVFFYGLGNFGEAPSDNVGDSPGVG